MARDSIGHCQVRFYEELNDFLPEEKRKASFETVFQNGCTAKALIEDLGVPHTEVDLLIVNGESEPFSYRLRDGDLVSVYPAFESWDIGGFTRVRPEPLRITRFVCDVHLGKLASLLRLFGFDALYDNKRDDEQLLALSRAGGRIILTRDRGLLKRSAATHGYCVRSLYPREQLPEVMKRFDLSGKVKPFSRCLVCNVELVRVEKTEILPMIPPKVAGLYDSFSRCPFCARIFWRGTHWERMSTLAGEILGADWKKRLARAEPSE